MDHCHRQNRAILTLFVEPTNKLGNLVIYQLKYYGFSLTTYLTIDHLYPAEGEIIARDSILVG